MVSETQSLMQYIFIVNLEVKNHSSIISLEVQGPIQYRSHTGSEAQNHKLKGLQRRFIIIVSLKNTKQHLPFSIGSEIQKHNL